MTDSNIQRPYAPLILSVVFVTLYLALIHMKPGNELHYTSIAWQMFKSHHFILPLQAGIPYAEKPPLLFWIMSAVWSLFGSNEFLTRATIASFYIVSMLFTGKIAHLLFPKQPRCHNLSLWVLLSSLTWLLWLPQFRFESLLTFFTVLAVYAYLKSLHEHQFKYYILLAMSLTGGLLTKGPVIFIYVLPIFILFKPTSHMNTNGTSRRHRVYVIGAALIALTLFATWIIAACHLGGPVYTHRLIFGNTVGRILPHGKSLDIGKYFYYLYAVIGFMFPGSILAILSINKQLLSCNTQQKLFFCCLASVIVFSVISQKGDRYLIPILPLLAILIASILSSSTRYKLQTYFSIGTLALLTSISILLNVIIKGIHINHLYQTTLILISLTGLASLLWTSIKQPHTNRLTNFFAIYTILVMAYLLVINLAINPFYDLRSFATQLSQLQKKGYVLGLALGQSQLDYLARLEIPTRLASNQQQEKLWISKHADYCLIRKMHLKIKWKLPYFTLTCNQNKKVILEETYPATIRDRLKKPVT